MEEDNSDLTLTTNSCEISESNANDTIDCSSSEESISDNEEYNRHLHARIMSLRETIHVLKAELQEERQNWQREIDGKREKEYFMNSLPLAYDYYDYDIQRYQDALMQSHYENRQTLQKQICFANYKRRLLEVENMCNLELLRVKQSVQILQPLQFMASEWSNNDHGDVKQKENLKEKEIKVEDIKTSKPEELSTSMENIIVNCDFEHCAGINEQLHTSANVNKDKQAQLELDSKRCEEMAS